MLKIIMLGLVLAAVALSGVMSVAISVASAETVPSPLQQVRDGVPIGEIVCSENRVLILSPSGMPACVFEESVLELKTRWMATDTMDNDNILLPYDSDLKNTKIQISTNKTTTGNMNNIDMGEAPKNIPTSDNSINYDVELMSILEKDLIFTNKNKETDLNTLSEIGPFGLPEKWPIYNVTYPRTAQVGVPFNVIYNYSFVIPDEETGSYVNFNEQCPEDGCGRMLFSAKVSSYVNVTSDNLEYDRDFMGGETIPMTNITIYEYHPEFDNTQPLEETFTFVINEPDIDYRIGQIHVQIQTSHHDDLVYFYVGEDGNIIFDPMLKKEIFEQSSLAKSDVPSVIKAASVIRTELNKLQERPPAWTTNTAQYPVGLRDGPPPELYGLFAESLLRQYPDEENFEELFIYHNYTQTWIDDFLNAMPHLKPDDSLTSQAMDFLASYMLLPLAYGAEVTTTVSGQLVNTDEDGSSVFVHGGTVCAYDRDSSGLNPIIETERTGGPQSTRGHNTNLVAHQYSSGNGIDVEKIQSLAQKQHDCDLNRRVYGQTTSTYTSYTNGHAKITTDFDYPEDLDKSIRTFRNTVCTDFDHDGTTAWHSVLGTTADTGSYYPSQSCRINTSDASITKHIWCNAFGQDRITLTVVFNTYDASGSSKETQLGGPVSALFTT